MAHDLTAGHQRLEEARDRGSHWKRWGQYLGERAWIFPRGEQRSRPVHGPQAHYRDDPHRHDLVLYDEYFHGDDGSGVGASHRTVWTGLVAKLLQPSGEVKTRAAFAALRETLPEVPV